MENKVKGLIPPMTDTSSTISQYTLATPFERLATILLHPASDSESCSVLRSDVHFDSHPARSDFLTAYSHCLARYISYLTVHPEWKTAPGRTLLHAMEWKPKTAAECSAFSTVLDIVRYVVTKISAMRFRETEYMIALGLLERFVVNAKDEFDLSSSTAAMTILISLITANKLSSDIPFSNAAYCQHLSIRLLDVFNSEVYFHKSLHMDLSISDEQLRDLLKICNCGVKNF